MPTELQLPFLQSAVVPLVLSVLLMAIGWWRSTHAAAVREARLAPPDAPADAIHPVPIDILPRIAGASTLAIIAVITGAWVLWSPGVFEGGWRITSAEKWIPWAAILCGTVAIVSSLPITFAARSVIGMVAAALALTLAAVTWSFVGAGAWRFPAEGSDLTTFAIAVIFGVLLWASLSSVLLLTRGVESGLTLVILCTAISIALAATGSAKLAQIAGALAAASGGACIIALFRPRLAMFGAAMLVAPMLAMLFYQGVRYTDSHTPASAIVFVLPIALAAAARLAARPRSASGLVPMVTRLALLASAAVIVVAIIALNLPKPPTY